MITVQFFGILILTLFLYWLLPWQRARNWTLVISSLLFLYLTDKWSFVVVLGLTVFTYLFGQLIHRSRKQGMPHFLGVAGLLLILALFKYLGFLTGIANELLSFLDGLPEFQIEHLLLPLGISYITFKHISYLTDIKWNLVTPGRPDDFLLYSSLFTIFVAGPIERFERFKPQVEAKGIRFDWSDSEFGFRRIVFGLFKKLVIADWLGYFTSPIWQNQESYTLWIRSLALLGYSLQIYFDFSGYSDIAIGSSRLFGLRIMENFRNPYLAPNISQFWRRWHISLSDWIRDYLFFPLSRVSQSKLWLKLAVPLIAMGFCGLWHGAAWHFIVWGLWHGMGLVLYQFWSEFKRKHGSLGIIKRTRSLVFAPTLINFVFVTFGWLYFR